MITTSSSDVNPIPQFLDSGCNRHLIAPVATQVSKPVNVNDYQTSQLHTLTQLRSQQNMMSQPLVQISGLHQLQHQQLQQQMLQQQFLKTGSILPSGQLQFLQQQYSALQYQFLLQALQQQSLLSVSTPTSQSSLGANAVRVSRSSVTPLSSNFKFGVSPFSSSTPTVGQSAPKINGTLSVSKSTCSPLSGMKSTIPDSLISQGSSTLIDPYVEDIVANICQPLNGTVIVSSTYSSALPTHPACDPVMASPNNLPNVLSGCIASYTLASLENSNGPAASVLTHLSSSTSSNVITTSSDGTSATSFGQSSGFYQGDLANQNKMDDDRIPSTTLRSKDNCFVSSKPDILTHIIEGYIIQEGPEPFPIERSMYINEFLDSENEDSDAATDEEEDEVADNNTDVAFKLKNKSQHIGSLERKQCQYCSIFFDPTTSVSKAGKFCSVTCSKKIAAYSRWMIHYASKGLMTEKHKYKKMSKKMSPKNKFNKILDDDLNVSDDLLIEPIEERTSKRTPLISKSSTKQFSPNSDFAKITQPLNLESRLPVLRTETPQKSGCNKSISFDGADNDCDASQWGVTEVCSFIQSLSGCAMYAEDFKKQEIDGQALLLLTEEHLMTTMNIKLGPALKICSNIRNLKECKNAFN